jgi:hypothetical protein
MITATRKDAGLSEHRFRPLEAIDSHNQQRRIAIMKWETPAFVEINMNAEIGGYGSDFTDRDPWGPVASPLDSAATADRTKAADAVRR